MRVFIAGGSGAVGLRVAGQLVARGHRVVATTTRAAKRPRLKAMGAQAFIVDGLDRVAVAEAVARAAPDVIVHEMTSLAGKPDLKHFDRWFATTNELRTRGTELLLSAAQTVGVSRIVAQSYTGWTNALTAVSLQTEDEPLDPHPASEQTESLAAIRFLERAVTDGALEGTALRYGSLYGPGASDTMLAAVKERQLPIIGNGDGQWSWIHVDDAAAATVAAVERGASGIYNIVDDEPARARDWLPYLARQIGAKPPLHVPVWLGRLGVGEAGVRWMTAARGASNAKAKRELGWRLRYPSWRQGFAVGLDAAPFTPNDLEALIGPPASPDETLGKAS